MSKQTDVAKYRILWERATREQALGEKPLREGIYRLRLAQELAAQRYAEALEANGQCPVCEKPKAECVGHIAYGSNEYDNCRLVVCGDVYPPDAR